MAHGMCKKHLTNKVRIAKKMIEDTIRKEKPYRATPDTCIEGIWHTRYKNEK